MNKRISSAILILFLIFSVSGQAYADTAPLGMSFDDNSALDTFLYVITTWGNVLAKLTGSYDTLANIGRFSHMAESWYNFVKSGGFTPEIIFKTILNLFDLHLLFDEEYHGESYSI